MYVVILNFVMADLEVVGRELWAGVIYPKVLEVHSDLMSVCTIVQKLLYSNK